MTDVEQDQVVAPAQRRHHRHHLVERQVEQNRARPGGANRLDGIRAGRQLGLGKLEAQPQRPAANPALAERHPGAVHRRALVAQRQPGVAAPLLVGGVFGAAEIEDREQRGLGRGGSAGGRDQQRQRAESNPANHRSGFHRAPCRRGPI